MAQDGQRRRSAGGFQPQVSEALPPAIADALFGRGAGFSAYQQATGMGAGMNTAMPPEVVAATLAAENAAAEPAEPAAPAGLRGDRGRRRGQASIPTPRQPVTSGPHARRNSRGQGSGAQPQSNPLPQTTGRSITEAVLPPLTEEQIRANAMAQLGQLSVGQLAALRGVIPDRPEPPSVEEQILQTIFDAGTQDFLVSQGPDASVEQAAAGREQYLQLLLQAIGRDPLLMPGG